MKFAIVSATAALLAATATAQAADMPARMPVKAPAPASVVLPLTWAGSYVGGFAGYGWGRANPTGAFDPALGFFYNFTGERYPFDADGFFGGGTLGYNWQSGAVVFGIEGEIGYLGLKGSRIDPNGIAFGFPDTTTSIKSDFFASIAGRLGFAAGNWLVYGKAGAAFLRTRANTIDPCIAPPAGCGTETLSMSGRKTMAGWTAGGGVEWAHSPAWSVKVEYAYFDFGDLDVSGLSSAGALYTQTVDVTAHTVKAGVNYRWGASPVVARF